MRRLGVMCGLKTAVAIVMLVILSTHDVLQDVIAELFAGPASVTGPSPQQHLVIVRRVPALLLELTAALYMGTPRPPPRPPYFRAPGVRADRKYSHADEMHCLGMLRGV